MNKQQALMQKAESLIKQAKKIEEGYNKKIGKFVVNLYRKRQITDDCLMLEIANILGEDLKKNLGKNVAKEAETEPQNLGVAHE
jgi:hypothetical protein